MDDELPSVTHALSAMGIQEKGCSVRAGGVGEGLRDMMRLELGLPNSRRAEGSWINPSSRNMASIV